MNSTDTFGSHTASSFPSVSYSSKEHTRQEKRRALNAVGLMMCLGPSLTTTLKQASASWCAELPQSQ
jgi:hypothetical protein